MIYCSNCKAQVEAEVQQEGMILRLKCSGCFHLIGTVKALSPAPVEVITEPQHIELTTFEAPPEPESFAVEESSPEQVEKVEPEPEVELTPKEVVVEPPKRRGRKPRNEAAR